MKGIKFDDARLCKQMSHDYIRSLIEAVKSGNVDTDFFIKESRAMYEALLDDSTMVKKILLLDYSLMNEFVLFGKENDMPEEVRTVLEQFNQKLYDEIMSIEEP